MKKSLLTVALLAVSGGAYAGPFYLDIGTNYDAPVVAPGGDKECDTCTSMKDEFLFTYTSSTTITDTDANGIDAGDLVSTDGGLGVGDLANNQITGFTPNETFGNNSNNGYGGSNWIISFSFTGLNGVVTGVNAGVPGLAYGPGLLELFVTFDGVTFNNFMDIAVTSAGTDGVGTAMFGTADFTNVDAGFNNLFHSGEFTCEGSSGFFDIWTNCGADAGTALTIDFEGHFDTNVLVTDFTPNDDGTFTLTSDHDGSGTFTVPEPGTIALMGGSLLLMGAMSRRKKKQA